MVRFALLHSLLLLCLLVSSAHAITLEAPLENASAEERAKTLFHEIRCLTCAGESIADSRATLANDLRHFIREKIKAGESNDAIIQALRTAYGDEILMRPPVQENTLPLWIAPFLLFLVGGFAVWRYQR